MSSGIQWITPPEVIAQNIEAHAQRFLVALYAAANAWGQKVQDAARTDAGWEDRSGAARGGLFFAVDGFGMGEISGDVSGGAKDLMTDVEVLSVGENELVIAVSHTVYYGKFLELAHGGRYAIILSELESHLPELETLMRRAYGSA